MNEKETQVLLPKGEWLSSLLRAFQFAKLDLLSTHPRSYEYRFATLGIPLVFHAVRSKEVISTIRDEDTAANAGFTGTDIAFEEGIDSKSKRTWEFPLHEFNPGAPKPVVYLGSTPNLREKIAEPKITDITGTTIYTEYPLITMQLLANESIFARVKPIQGGSEGRWRFDGTNGAVVTIRNTDATLRANEIEPMLDIMGASILYVESDAISGQDRQRIDDLREKVYLALAQFNLK